MDLISFLPQTRRFYKLYYENTTNQVIFRVFIGEFIGISFIN